MRVLIGLLALGMMGCTTFQEPEPPVQIAVPVSCVKTAPPARPESMFKLLPETASDFELVRALLIDHEKLGIYATNLEVMISGCR